MKVGTVGTGFIVDRMISAMKDSGIEVIACYSRSLEKAKEFCEKHQMKRYYSNLEELLKDELKGDRAKNQVEGFTKLNLMELTRKHICSHLNG